MYTRIIPIRSINKYDPKELVEIAESEYQSQISEIAEAFLKTSGEKPFLLLSGPSGSAKTVTSHRIRETLEKRGHKVKVLSMDNYFLPLGDPKNQFDENGKIDLESPKRLDIDLLKNQTDKIMRREEVEIPLFDFANQLRKHGESYKRGKDDFVILEGIHALNPLITDEMRRNAKTLYVSVRTRIKKSDGELLHPSKIRLMRRLSRDNLFRGRALTQIFENFENVQRGEEVYIMPYKHLADFEIDTFLPFEVSVYKMVLSDKLREFDDKSPFFEKATELLLYLDELCGIETEHLPENSPIREFVGGNILMS